MTDDETSDEAENEEASVQRLSGENLGIRVSGQDPQAMVAVCWLLSLIAFTLGALLFVSARRMTPQVVLMFLSGGSLAAFAFLFGIVLASRRRFLRITPTGFVYSTIVGERQFDDDDVMCISLMNRNNFFAGNLKSVTERFIMWVETDRVPESIICTLTLAPGQESPLEPLIVRLIQSLLNAARQAHLQGERVEGDGWALERNQLLLNSRQSTAVTDVRNLAAAEVVDEQIHIWRTGDERPIGRIPLQTANAHILLLLLHELMPEQSAEAEPSVGSLGRLLFERGVGGLGLFIAGWTIALFLGITGLGMVLRAAGINGRARRMRLVWSGALISIGAFIYSLIILLRQRGRFRRFEHGIQQKGMFATRELKFTEIGNMSCAESTNYVHGMYAGKTLTFNFVPMPSTGLKPIRYSTNVRNADPELDRLRDDVAIVIGKRMQEFWTQHKQCPWIQFLRFVENGLEYRPLGFAGRKAPVIIPLETIAGVTQTENGFQIWIQGQQNPAISEDTAQPNCYPGLYFLRELMHSRQAHLDSFDATRV